MKKDLLFWPSLSSKDREFVRSSSFNYVELIFQVSQVVMRIAALFLTAHPSIGHNSHRFSENQAMAYFLLLIYNQ